MVSVRVGLVGAQRIGALDLALGTEQDLNGSDPSSDIAVVFRASITTP